MFKNLFGSKAKPWTQGTPILEQIKNWDGRQPLPLIESAAVLPTEDAAETPPDQADPSDRYDEARLVTEFIELIRLLMIRGNEQARGALYEAAISHPITSLIDIVLHELHRQSWWQAQKIRTHARWFLSESRHLEALRLGIALIGLCGDENDFETLEILSKHEEFTIVAANAVAALDKNPVQQWWQMAKHTSGWGKVHLVKRLARRCGDRPDIQSWLLRYGWRDCVSPEYVAYSCAQAGRLEQALSVDQVDAELMDSAGVLLNALLSAGPAEHLEDYEGGLAAITRWLYQLQTWRPANRPKPTIQRIRQWMNEGAEAKTWERRAEQLGWTDEARADVTRLCDQLLSD